jgi:hypothetical protein
LKTSKTISQKIIFHILVGGLKFNPTNQPTKKRAGKRKKADTQGSIQGSEYTHHFSFSDQERGRIDIKAI